MFLKPPDAKRSYGYARFEAFGALINGTLLFVVAAYIFWEAIGRFANPPEVASTGMLVIAALGLVVNLISMRLRKTITGKLKDSFDIHHLTLQMETIACDSKACDTNEHSCHDYAGHPHD